MCVQEKCQSSSSSQVGRGRLVAVSEVYSLNFVQEKCKTSSSSQFGRGGVSEMGRMGVEAVPAGK